MAATALFFILAVILVPFGVGSDPDILSRIAGGVIWLAAVLAGLLSLQNLWADDVRNGTLDLIAQSRHSFMFYAALKILAYFLMTGLPVVLLSPALGFMLNLPMQAYAPLVMGLLLGTPLLSLWGAVGAALLQGSRARNGFLLLFILLPLYLPVVIFGASAVNAAIQSLPYTHYLLVLAALLAISLPSAPLIAATLLRFVIEES